MKITDQETLNRVISDTAKQVGNTTVETYTRFIKKYMLLNSEQLEILSTIEQNLLKQISLWKVEEK